ncbi:hypothetical protein L7F22_027595 [Adiantum nelumboides]|nr:hypothetical protein [Adiantum nelumboides]
MQLVSRGVELHVGRHRRWAILRRSSFVSNVRLCSLGMLELQGTIEEAVSVACGKGGADSTGELPLRDDVQHREERHVNEGVHAGRRSANLDGHLSALSNHLKSCCLGKVGFGNVPSHQLLHPSLLRTGITGSPTPSNSFEPSVKDNSSYLCRSQSGSMLTECSEFDTIASTVQREEGGLRRQANHCGKTQIDDGLRLSKTIANASGPSRPCEMSTERPVLGTARAKAFNDGNCMNQSNVLQNRPFFNGGVVGMLYQWALTIHSLFYSRQSNKNEIDQKLEIVKRKLHQGYQQAENS